MNRSERITLLGTAAVVLVGLVSLIVRLQQLRAEVDRLGGGVAEAYSDMTSLREDTEDLRSRINALKDSDGGRR